jgi:hypothetical protein
MSRVSIKIGDIFSVPIDTGTKKYFQYVSNDLTQLNSEVIRAFKSKYAIGDNPELVEIAKGEVDFYAHCVIKLGVKMSLWEKVGDAPIFGDLNPLFRGTNDYGSRPGEQVALSENWYVWHINDDKFKRIGKLTGEYQNAEIGVVVTPVDVVDRMRSGKYNFIYPGF